MKRVIWIVLDSVGIGGMEDALAYGDHDPNTLKHIYEFNQGLTLPNMEQLGLSNIAGIDYMNKVEAPEGSFARLKELSKGKDTTTGHWEMVGIYTEEPFPTYPQGFPKEIIDTFEKKIGREIIGNYPASGTQILDDLGPEHLESGKPIVYTSADSVFQIAAHEEVIAIEELYKMCEVARELLKGEHEVSRVIARPFIGKEGEFVRTPRRKDFAVSPPKDNLLTAAKAKGLEVIGVGKIEDIFNGEGITQAFHTKDNIAGMDQTIKLVKDKQEGIIFINLVDFDMKWGHRRDPKAYGEGLEVFDKKLGELLEVLKEDDLLIITADHGCDPTASGTDHTRECAPLLVYSKSLQQSRDLGVRESFADTGQTLAELFDLPKLKIGTSFLSELK